MEGETGALPDDILSQLSIAVLAVDRNWQVRFANAAAGRLLERDPAELEGSDMWGDHPEAIGTPLHQTMERAMRDQAEASVVNHYGRLDRWFAAHVVPFDDGLLVSLYDITEQKQSEERAAELNAQHVALQHVVELVAQNSDMTEVFSEAARVVAELIGVEAAAVVRFLDGDRREYLGVWNASGVQAPLNVPEPFSAGSELEEMARTGNPVHRRADQEPLGGHATQLGLKSTLNVPVVVDGTIWGGLATASYRTDAYAGGSMARQTHFAGLLAIAVAAAESREHLRRLAAVDSLTGLANHRAFHELLGLETHIAVAGDSMLSVAVLDLDNFKQINDSRGHLAGDRVLGEVGRRLQEGLEPDHTAARVGGDEFALLMPGCDRAAAEAVVARARAVVAEGSIDGDGTFLTLSAGVCDLGAAGHPERLFESADRALFWVKLNGRGGMLAYDEDLMRHLTDYEESLARERASALSALTALARAVDAKDPVTQQHAERVANLVAMLARECGWSDERIRRLREAALVHDVGKIGVPDSVLLSPRLLSPEEYEVIKEHAALGADIVDGVLDPEQVSWVRSHHERPDGTGYPDGLREHELSEGAALLSVADSIDVMTISRPYSKPIPLSDSVEECESLAGEQFTAPAVRALRSLYAGGVLTAWDAGGPVEPRK